MDKFYAVPLIIVFIIAGVVYAFNFSPLKPAEPEFETMTASGGEWRRLNAETEPEDNADIIKIYITGAVENPGVYELETDSRVVDAVEAAGGATAEADLERINMSERIYDEQHVVIRRIGDPEPEKTAEPGKTAEPAAAEAKAPVKAPDSGLININTATQAELETLPNIGAVTAGRIIEYREQNGGFDDIEDIMNVERIGAKTFSALEGLITVGE